MQTQGEASRAGRAGARGQPRVSALNNLEELLHLRQFEQLLNLRPRIEQPKSHRTGAHAR